MDGEAVYPGYLPGCEEKSILKLLDASRRAGEAERDRMIATIELLNLQKELEKIAEK